MGWMLENTRYWGENNQLQESAQRILQRGIELATDLSSQG